MRKFAALVLLFGFCSPMCAQISFTLSSSPGVGSGPQYITAADVNSDGRMDLVTANSGNNTLSVLTNGGAGGFVLSSSPGVGNDPNSIVAVDVNGDGVVDLISANYNDGTLSVLTNNGSGQFLLSSTPSTGAGSQPLSVTAADVNGDGKVDMISADSATADSAVTVLTNNGSGGFAVSGVYPVGENPWCVTAADVNGDDKVDLITANYGGGSLSVLTNNGSGGYATAGTYPVGSGPRSVVAADVNGDGKLDLICANSLDGTLSVLTNNGSGGFSIAGLYHVGSNPVNVVAADVNGDGYVDLVSANFGDSTVSVLVNDGSGNFTTGGTFHVGSNPRAVVAVDVNGDGKLDLCTANNGASTVTVLTNGTAFPAASLPVITSQPVGQTNLVGATVAFSVGAKAVTGIQLFSYQWQLGGTNLSAATNSALLLTNLNLSQAGSYDVVITNNAGSVTSNPALLAVLPLNGAAPLSFTLSSSPGVGPQPQFITAADVNSDGRMDLVTANSGNNTLSVLTNGGAGGFVLSSSPGVGNDPNSIVAVDVNGDGVVDLISANYNDGTLSVLTNNGTGRYVLSSSPSTGAGSQPLSVTAADINGDGKVDLISAVGNTSLKALAVFTNDGAGGFVSAGTFGVGYNPWCVAAADVNGDGKVDLISANYGDSTLSVLTNNGSGGFGTAGTYPVGSGPRSVVAADVNGDGKLDLICANSLDNTLSVLTNNGSGGFSIAGLYHVGSNPVNVVAADVNGDGYVDLVSANFGDSTVSVLVNDGSGNFTTGGTFHVGSNPRAVVAVDVNGDGKLDLCTANNGASTVTVLTNGTAFPAASLPVITSQPVGQTNLVGATVAFSVGAKAVTGIQLFSYQWQLGGTNLSAATNSALLLTNLNLSQAGSYDVVITNNAGSVTSNPALLAVQFIVVELNGQLVSGTVSAVAPATVTLSGGYPGGFLFYTLDGSTPTTSSTYYDGPFLLTNSVILRTLALSADFTQTLEGDSVAMQIVPTYILQTSVIGSGTVAVNPPGGLYPSNSVVSLTATPVTNWVFDHWSGDAAGNQNPVNVTMNGPRSVQAVFVQTAYPLTLTTPGGGRAAANGLVTPAATYYPTGSVVSVVAMASNGWSFLHWQGDASGTNNPLNLVISQTNNIQAVFGTVVATNSLGGVITLGQPNPVPFGTVLAVSAVPNPGNYFVAWNGSLSGTNAPATITVTNPTPAIGALFATLPGGTYSLTVIVAGNGSVTNSPRRGYYNPGDSVSLNAIANAGAPFLGWSRDAAGTNSSLSVQMTNNLVIQANFGVFPLVSVSPLSLIVLAGSNAVLTATAAGSAPLAYQWQNSQGAVAGETNAVYTIFDIQPTNADGYSVIVSNSFGSVTSAVSTVTVIGLPTITNQPPPLTTVIVGHSASFTVGAIGWPALAYQWQFNGTNLNGATSIALTVTNPFPADGGIYTVAVTNIYGSVTSNPAMLTVSPPGIVMPARLANGQFQFTFDTAVGVAYEVQYSTNLIDWYSWFTADGNGQPLTLTDPGTAGSPQRFYRIVLSPQ